MAIDWDEIIEETEQAPDEPAAADEVDERAADGEPSLPEVTPTADD